MKYPPFFCICSGSFKKAIIKKYIKYQEKENANFLLLNAPENINLSVKKSRLHSSEHKTYGNSIGCKKKNC